MTNSDVAPVPSKRQQPFWKYFLISLPWALPFAVFFWLLNGAPVKLFPGFVQVSLIFTLVIRLALWSAERWIEPRLYRDRDPDDVHWIVPGAMYMIVGILGAILATAITDLVFWRGFVGGGRAWIVSVLFAILFSIMFGGIAYARAFYRDSLERAAQVERIRAELARAELRALRAQVNPHFLFNTLNAIAALITVDPRAAEDVVTRLADVFRYALTSTDRESVRLGDELAFLRSYLEIEHVRLGDKLRVVEHIDAMAADVPVPPLLLQPLVENAVRYAVADREEGGTVAITATCEADLLLLTVADDGPGFIVGAPPRGHGVGLESVRERVRMAGPTHTFTLETAPGRGTRIVLSLPLRPVSLAPAAAPEARSC